MINEDKVAAMTRIAAYEAGEGKQDFKTCGYFKSDYVGFQVLKTWICTTIAFGLILGCYIIYEMDSLMAEMYQLNVDSIVGIVKKFLVVYLIVCCIYMMIAWITSRYSYIRSHKALVRFDRRLGALGGNTDEEEA